MKIYTVLLMRNGEPVSQASSKSLSEVKGSLPENLQPYFDDAVYYKQEKVWLGSTKYNIFYSSWNIQE